MSTMFAQTIAPRDLSSVTRYDGELPAAAFDPRVTVICDLDDYTVGYCNLCDDEHQADFRITYRYNRNGSPYPVDVCEWHADDQLRELLDRAKYFRAVVDITLHLPTDWAPEPDEAANLLSQPCEGQQGCAAQVTHSVAWTEPSGDGRREVACRAHALDLFDYAGKVCDGFTPVQLSKLPTVTRELVAA